VPYLLQDPSRLLSFVGALDGAALDTVAVGPVDGAKEGDCVALVGAWEGAPEMAWDGLTEGEANGKLEGFSDLSCEGATDDAKLGATGS
jgi:hypothetical protein